VHDHLIQKFCLETLPCDVRAQDDNIAAIGGLLRDGHRVFDADVQETAGNALHDRRFGRGIVSQHEERSAERAAVEARLNAVLHVLRAPPDQKRPGRGDDLVDRLTRSRVHPEGPTHVVVPSRDEAIEAHHRVPEQLAHSRAPFHDAICCFDRYRDQNSSAPLSRSCGTSSPRWGGACFRDGAVRKPEKTRSLPARAAC
jgi:hypothetical protein